MPAPHASHLLWLDFETDGNDNVLEVAAMTTFRQPPFTEQGHSFESLIWPWLRGSGMVPDVQVDAPAVVREMHHKSGLWVDLHNGLAAGSVPRPREVDEQLVAKLDEWGVTRAVLAGSGVGTFDHRLVRQWLPKTFERLMFYTFDVGVVRRYRLMLGKQRWKPPADLGHRAMADVLAHLTEARYYVEQDR